MVSFFFSPFFNNFQFRIQNNIPFVLGCLLRFVGFDFVNFLILIFLVIFHIYSLILCLTRIRVFYSLQASLWFLFLFICIVASKEIQNFININFKMFFLHSFWWTSNFSLWIKGISYGFKSYYLKIDVICFLWLSTSFIYQLKNFKTSYL